VSSPVRKKPHPRDREIAAGVADERRSFRRAAHLHRQNRDRYSPRFDSFAAKLSDFTDKFGYSTSETPPEDCSAAAIPERAIARELVPIHRSGAIDRAYQLLHLTHPFVVH